MPVNRQFSRSLIASRDPRSLGRYEVNGPDDVKMTDAPVSMQSPESTFTKILRGLSQDIGIGPQELATAAPMMLGPVLKTRAQAYNLWDTMMRNAGGRLGGDSLPVQFMRAAYPTLRRLAKWDVNTGRQMFMDTPNGPAELLGGFSPTEIPMRQILEDQGRIVPKGAILPEGVLEINQLPQGRSIPEVIGHELTHAVQQRRDPIGINTSYIPPDVDPKRYYDQSWEVLARQGGATAKRKYETFLRLLQNK